MTSEEKLELFPTADGGEAAPKTPSKGWKVLSIVLFVLSIASVYFGVMGMALATNYLRPSASELWTC